MFGIGFNKSDEPFCSSGDNLLVSLKNCRRRERSFKANASSDKR